MTENGTVLGPWVVDHVLEEDEVARVYVCHHHSDPSTGAAVKVPLRHAVDSAHLRRRFDRERDLLLRLARTPHPNLVRVEGASSDVSGETPWVAMELLEGSALREAIAAFQLPGGTRLSSAATRLRVAIDVGSSVAAGAAHAHALGAVHGDIKPENIFVTSTGRTVLIDFGADRDEHRSRPTRASGRSLPSPQYAAPEVLRGDHRASAGVGRQDTYSLGVVLYELLSRTPPELRPRRAPDGTEQLLPRVQPLVVPPMHPDWIRELVSEMTSIEPAQRPDMASVASRLKAGDKAPRQQPLPDPRPSARPALGVAAGRGSPPPTSGAGAERGSPHRPRIAQALIAAAAISVAFFAGRVGGDATSGEQPPRATAPQARNLASGPAAQAEPTAPAVASAAPQRAPPSKAAPPPAAPKAADSPPAATSASARSKEPEPPLPPPAPSTATTRPPPPEPRTAPAPEPMMDDAVAALDAVEPPARERTGWPSTGPELVELAQRGEREELQSLVTHISTDPAWLQTFPPSAVKQLVSASIGRHERPIFPTGGAQRAVAGILPTLGADLSCRDAKLWLAWTYGRRSADAASDAFYATYCSRCTEEKPPLALSAAACRRERAAGYKFVNGRCVHVDNELYLPGCP